MARNYPAVSISLMPSVKPNDSSLIAAFAKSYYHSQNVLTVPNYPTSLFYWIGERTLDLKTRRGRQYELGRTESGEAALVVDNSDRLFDPTNTSSPLYGNVKPYRGLHISAAHNGATDSSTFTAGNIVNDVNTYSHAWNPAPAYSDSGGFVTTAQSISVNTTDANFEATNINQLNWWTHYAVPASSTYYAKSISSHASLSTAQKWQGNQSLLTANALGAGIEVRQMLDVPVIAGTTFTASLYAYVTAGTPTFRVYDGAYYYNATAVGTSNMSGAAWTRYSITWTATSPRATLAVVVSNGQTVYVDGVQVNVGNSATTFTTSGLPVYDLFTGFIERYPMNFLAPNRSEANLVATDYISALSRVNLDSAYLAETTLLSPMYYYPLDSESEATTAANLSSFNQSALVKTTDIFATGGTIGAVTFGEETAQTGIIAAGTTGVTIVSGSKSNQALVNSNTSDLIMNPPLVNSVSYTVELWFKIDSATKTWFGSMFNLEGSDVYHPTLTLVHNDVAGTLSCYAGDLGFGSGTSHFITYDVWHHFMVNLQYNKVTQQFNLHSVLDGDDTLPILASGTATLVDVTGVRVGAGRHNSFLPSPDINCAYAHVAIYRGDTTSKALSRYQMGVSAYAGELLSSRFARLFGLAGFNYPLIHAEESNSYAQAATNLAGQSLFDALQTVADSETSNWFVDGRGTVVFNNRRHRQEQILPVSSFADNDSGLTTYQAGAVVLNYDSTYILNSIAINRANGVVSSAYDDLSIAEFFPRTYDRTLYNTSDLEAIDCAWYLLDRYKQPQTRVEGIVLTPTTHLPTWGTMLPVELDDLISVKKKQLLGANDWEFPSFVERIEHELDGMVGDWETRFYLSPQLRTYNFVGAYNTTLNALVSAGATSLVLNRTLNKDKTNLPAGLMLELEPASVTNDTVVISGSISQTATTMTVPVWRATPTIQTQVTALLELDDLLLSVADTSAFTGVTTFLVGMELVTGSVTSSTLITLTARAVGGTLLAQHDLTEIVIAVNSAAGTLAGHAANSLVSEWMPADTTLPSAIVYNQLDSMVVSIGGAKTTTTPSSGLAYSSIPFVSLPDFNNTPTADIAEGAVARLYSVTTSANEMAGVLQPSLLNTDGSWSCLFYPLAGSKLLAADLTMTATTVTTTVAVPAGTRAILIDLEWMEVTAGAGTTTLTVVRGTPDSATWSPSVQSVHYHFNNTTAVWFVTTTTGLIGTYGFGCTATFDNASTSMQMRLAY